MLDKKIQMVHVHFSIIPQMLEVPLQEKGYFMTVKYD